MRGAGRTLFVAILLLIGGVLNVVYGIAAISDADFYAGEITYVFSNVDTWGWVTLLVGAVQVVAGASLMGGGSFGWVVGVFAASLGAINALIAVGGAHPFWSLGVFAICLIVLHGLVVFREDAATRLG
jgi:hypothetical protein